MEIWKRLNEHYEVSNYGNVKSLRKNIILKPSIRPDGYYFLNVSGFRHRRTWKVHQLIAHVFLPNSENKPQINHKNGIKTDNRVDNLEWCTASENVRHSFDVLKREPTKCFGSSNKMSRKVIDNLTGKEFETIRSAALFLGLKDFTLSAMLSGRNKNKTNYSFL